MTARNMTLDVALAEATEGYAAANPKSAARYEEACRSLPGGNTRTVLFYDPFPLSMAKGEGARLRDLDGHEYRDFLGEYTAGLYGHSHPRILEEVREALAAGIVLGAPNRYEVELAELVCARFPSVERVRFCNSGTEANLMAIGLARAVTGRDKVLVFEGAYHGSVLFFKEGESGPVNAPFQFVFAPYNDTAAALAAIDRHGDGLAAILVEPMMGSGGCIEGGREFLAALREAADRHGALLVFDEVMTSRLGPGGRQGELGILPRSHDPREVYRGRPDVRRVRRACRSDRTLRPAPPGCDPACGDLQQQRAHHVGGSRRTAGPLHPGREAVRAERARRCSAPAAAGGSRRARGPLPGDGLRLDHRAALAGRSRCAVRPTRRPPRPAARSLAHLEMIRRGFYFARRGFMSLSLPLEDGDYDGFVDAFADFLDEHREVLAG